MDLDACIQQTRDDIFLTVIKKISAVPYNSATHTVKMYERVTFLKPAKI